MDVYCTNKRCAFSCVLLVRLTGEVTVREDKTIFYGAPVGTHPSMANLIAARACETMGKVNLA